MTETVRISAIEFGREVSRYQDMALNQTIIVTQDGRDQSVLISVEEYSRLKRRDRQVYAAGELPGDIVQALRDSEMDTRHHHLDDLLKDWSP